MTDMERAIDLIEAADRLGIQMEPWQRDMVSALGERGWRMPSVGEQFMAARRTERAARLQATLLAARITGETVVVAGRDGVHRHDPDGTVTRVERSA